MKHKICKGKIYVIPMPIYGVLKHFVEDFKLHLTKLSWWAKLSMLVLL